MIKYIKGLFSKDTEIIQKNITVRDVAEMMRPAIGDVYTDANSTKYYKSWVYAAANYNAKNIADAHVKLVTNETPKVSRYKTIPEKLVKAYHPANGNYNEILVHPILDLLNKPNEYDGVYQFLYKVDLFLELTGDAYVYVTKENGIPSKLEVLYSQFVNIQTDGLNRITHYNYGVAVDGKYQFSFTPDEIIHIKFFNPDDILYGISPLSACAAGVDLVNAMTTYEQALNRNLGIPAGIIKYKEQIPEEQRRSVEAQWQKKFSSVGRAGKVLVTDDDMDFQSLGIVPREMNFLEGKKFTREEVFSCLGVPMSLMITESVNRSNMQTSLISYHHSTLLPRLKLISQCMTKGLISQYPIIRNSNKEVMVIFCRDEPVDYELNILKADKLAQNKALTINEMRVMLGLAELEDQIIGNQMVQTTSTIPINPIGESK
jgi:HK97 family phage portal protein